MLPKHHTFSDNPIYQGIVILSIALLFTFVLKALPLKSQWQWKIAIATLLFYSVQTIIFSIKQKVYKSYILKSIISFFALSAILIGFSWISFDNEKEQIRIFKIIYSCLLLFFIVLIGLSILLRNLLVFVSGKKPEDFFDQAGDRSSSSRSS